MSLKKEKENEPTRKTISEIVPMLGLIGLLHALNYKGRPLFKSNASIFWISQLSFFALFSALSIIGTSLNIVSVTTLGYLIILFLSILYGSWSVSYLQK